MKSTREDYASDEDEQVAPDMTQSFLAKANPAEVASVSEELQPAFKKSIKKYYKALEEEPEDLEYGPHDIYPIQYVVAHTFMSTKGITSFYASTSFGKTLTGIAISELCDVCLILVPNNVLPGWIKRIELYGLYNVRKPETSPILLYSHTKAKAHYDYLSTSSESTLSKRDRLIVLAPHFNVNEVMSHVFTEKTVRGREFTVIVDEAHKTIKAHKVPGSTESPGGLAEWVQNKIGGLVTRELLMSASELTAKVMKANGITRIDHVIHVFKTNDMPVDYWTVKLMVSPSYREDEEEWVQEVKSIVANRDRVVIVCEADARAILVGTRGTFKGKVVYEYRKQLGAEDKFNNEDSAVLFLTKLQTVGLNLNADSMIILNPGEATTEQLIQMTKRIIRSDNPNREVDLFMLCGSPKEYYRVLYAKAFSLLEWQYGRQEVVNTSMVYKAIATIRMLGYADPQDIDRVDLCVFLADYAELEAQGRMTNCYEDILAWWEANKSEKTILDANKIKNLIVL